MKRIFVSSTFKDMNIDKQLKMTNVDCNAVLYFTKVFLDEIYNITYYNQNQYHLL